ncbi:MAG: Trehalose/maltose transport system permease protein MalF [Nitrospira sp.]|nr:MAG: Trehalose/maltose transport system permease protein MalF [Nitrospira sp.]
MTGPNSTGAGGVRHLGRLSERAWGYLLSAPAFVLLGFVALAPIGAALWLSLYRRMPVFGVDEFIGAAHYIQLWSDERFWAACRVTLYFTALSVAAELVVGFGLALLLDRLTNRSGQSSPWEQAMILLPWAVPTVVSAQIWKWLYQPDYGLLNYLLLQFGLIAAPIDWLADPDWAIHAAVVMDVWKTTPFVTLLLLAGLKALPQDLYAAAKVDGAGSWEQFRRITLPLLMPIVLIVLVFRTMDGVRVFDAVFVLTSGGPGNTTETLSIYAYKTLFQTLQFGYGSALATAMFILVAGLSALYVVLLRRHFQESA